MSIILIGFFFGCSSAKESSDVVALDDYPRFVVLESSEGTASFYHNKFHGRKTASGERYDKTALTAAHRSYPFGTILRVTSMKNSSSVIVRINDRGPAIRSRIIDLSREAAESLEMIRDGLVSVRLEVLSWGES